MISRGTQIDMKSYGTDMTRNGRSFAFLSLSTCGGDGGGGGRQTKVDLGWETWCGTWTWWVRGGGGLNGRFEWNQSKTFMSQFFMVVRPLRMTGMSSEKYRNNFHLWIWLVPVSSTQTTVDQLWPGHIEPKRYTIALRLRVGMHGVWESSAPGTTCRVRLRIKCGRQSWDKEIDFLQTKTDKINRSRQDWTNIGW